MDPTLTVLLARVRDQERFAHAIEYRRQQLARRRQADVTGHQQHRFHLARIRPAA